MITLVNFGANIRTVKMTPEEMIASLLETLREAVIEERAYDSSNGWIDKAELLI